MKKKYFKIFQNCLFTIGAKRAAIFDFQRGDLLLIPVSLAEFAIEINGKKEDYINKYKEDNKEIIKEYLEFLFQKEIIFYCSSKEELACFPPLNLSWSNPFLFSNFIIELDSLASLKTIEKKCQNYYFECIQVIAFFHISDLNELITLCKKIDNIQTKSKQVYFKNEGNLLLKDLSELCDSFPNIESILGFNSKNEERLIYNGSIITLIRQEHLSNLHCGIVHQQYFNLELPHYTESLAHNTCLNRKISIDVDGNIKNCPSMKESFGNIKDITLEEAINKPGFKKYWNITKDEITKCKDCEFRYICTDCRAFIDNPEDMYSAPLKCGYNPYTCEWEEWSTNPLKQQAIEYYGMSEIIKQP